VRRRREVPELRIPHWTEQESYSLLGASPVQRERTSGGASSFHAPTSPTTWLRVLKQPETTKQVIGIPD
jgi:hypothetical protein